MIRRRVALQDITASRCVAQSVVTIAGRASAENVGLAITAVSGAFLGPVALFAPLDVFVTRGCALG
jgi:hypothetical protein